MAYTASLTWQSPWAAERQRFERMLKQRDRICPKSPFFSEDLKGPEHLLVMKAAQLDYKKRKMENTISDMEKRKAALGKGVKANKPMSGKIFSTNHSTVLSMQTIWCPQIEKTTATIAPWPTRAEFKYEGDERIASLSSHNRFFPHPRQDANGVVNWKNVPFLRSYPMDNVTGAISIAGFQSGVQGMQGSKFSGDEAKLALGSDLLGALDFKDVYW